MIVTLPEIIAPDEAVTGRIVVLDCASALPFQVQRVYWIHGMRLGEKRGFHAHRSLVQAIVAVHGSVSFELDDGFTRTTHVLSHPTQYLVVPPASWRDFVALAPDTCLMVLASASYDEADYIRDYTDFLTFARQTPVEG